MRVVRLVFGLVLLSSLTSLLIAADVTGKWKSSDDSSIQWTFTLKSEGNTVTGTMTSTEGKEQPISDGKLDGDNISFSVASEWQGQPIKLVVKGKVAGDEMQLRIDTEDGSWGTDVTVKRSAS